MNPTIVHGKSFVLTWNMECENDYVPKVMAMDDKRKDVAIIEASALLATLVFIILSFYMSYYAQWYGMWQRRCTVNPNIVIGLPIWRRWLPLSALWNRTAMLLGSSS
jgi:hypothetical protein